MIYISCENQLFKALTFKELVCALYNTSFDASENKAKWMKKVKQRIKIIYEKNIDDTDYKKFILDLDKIGFLKVFACHDCDHFVNVEIIRCKKGITSIDPESIQCPFLRIKKFDGVNL